MSVNQDVFNALLDMGIDAPLARAASARFGAADAAVNWCFSDAGASVRMPEQNVWLGLTRSGLQKTTRRSRCRSTRPPERLVSQDGQYQSACR